MKTTINIPFHSFIAHSIAYIMKPILLTLFFSSFILVVKSQDSLQTKTNANKPQSGSIPFQSIPFDPAPRKALYPPHPFKHSILFKVGDSVRRADGKFFPSKGKPDYTQFVTFPNAPVTLPAGFLWINHETTTADSLGDGGGASVLTLRKMPGKGWFTVQQPFSIDFKNVGGTWNNCLGGVTPWGTILTAEEYEPNNNAQIYDNGKGIRDTTNFDNAPKYLNYGWMVEVNPLQRRATAKRKAMGRFSHESALCMKDSQTVYMTDDFAPGVFFKFVADKKRDLSSGKLYAFKMTDTGGEWLLLPSQRDSLYNTRDLALKKGATIFIRLEDIDSIADGTLLITETGIDSVNLSAAIAIGGKPAKHLEQFKDKDGIYRDYYGRILKFDPKTNTMSVFLEGGKGEKNMLSNPDNIVIDRKRNHLYIFEDNNATTQGRGTTEAGTKFVNEIYVLELANKSPKIDDLKRFFIAPMGSEPTGGCFSNDYSTLFLSIQHTDANNEPPFNTDLVMAISGYEPDTAKGPNRQFPVDSTRQYRRPPARNATSNNGTPPGRPQAPVRPTPKTPAIQPNDSLKK